jgi:MFS family permease
MLMWGIASVSMMLAPKLTHFYVLRFLLGVFEAGFFPGIVLYLTYWYPARRRAAVLSIFFAGVALSLQTLHLSSFPARLAILSLAAVLPLVRGPNLQCIPSNPFRCRMTPRSTFRCGGSISHSTHRWRMPPSRRSATTNV